jgi:SAM-dependent methyltransferase
MSTPDRREGDHSDTMGIVLGANEDPLDNRVPARSLRMANPSAASAKLRLVVENPFIVDAAGRYNRYRPYHHERTLERAFGMATPEPGPALDVACGTGLSTMALWRYGIRAVGVDTSAPMLRVARSVAGVPVAQAEAEHLPVSDTAYSLLTCGSGLHWINRDRFWAEARRVLLPGGLVIVYDHGFLAQAAEASGFAEWHQKRYLPRYPAPPRNSAPEHEMPPGFEKVGDEVFTETIPLDHRSLVGYLLTQSNTIIATSTSSESFDETAEWITSETDQFFANREQTVSFGYWGRVQCVRAI